MNKEEAYQNLQKEFAKYTVKYPILCVQLSKYISSQSNHLEAIATCIYKLMSVDDFINDNFFNIIK